MDKKIELKTLEGIHYGIFLIFLIIGLVGIIISSLDLTYKLISYNDYKVTMGVVIDFEEELAQNNKGNNTINENKNFRNPVIKFVTKDKNQYKFKEELIFKNFKKGDWVQIIYDEDNPQNARINKIVVLYNNTFFVFIIGIFMIIASFVYPYRKYKFYLKKIDLL